MSQSLQVDTVEKLEAVQKVINQNEAIISRARKNQEEGNTEVNEALLQVGEGGETPFPSTMITNVMTLSPGKTSQSPTSPFAESIDVLSFVMCMGCSIHSRTCFTCRMYMCLVRLCMFVFIRAYV
jgi:hypothetical protein